MNAQHTPGPWTIMGQDVVHEYSAKKVGVIAIAAWAGDDDGKETEANIRLIAAAPELLKALQMCERFIQNEYNVPINVIREAIAKAL